MKMIIILVTFIIAGVTLLKRFSKYNMKTAKALFVVLFCVLTSYIPIIFGNKLLSKIIKTIANGDKGFLAFFIEGANKSVSESIGLFSVTLIVSIVSIMLYIFLYIYILYKLLGLIINYNKSFIKKLLEDFYLFEILQIIIKIFSFDVKEKKEARTEKYLLKKYCKMLN